MATLTITTTAEQDARIASAFGKQLDLGRDATGAEVKQEIIRRIKRTVVYWERRQYELDAIAADVDLGDIT